MFVKFRGESKPMTLQNPESLMSAVNTQPVVWEQGTLTHAYLFKGDPTGKSQNW